jgi:anti-anti-sigma factor
MSDQHRLQFEEQFDGDGARRLALVGELDMSTAPALEDYMRQGRRSGDLVRLDLSRLAFMDSTGLAEIIRAVQESRADGWRFEVDEKVSKQVDRLLAVAGVRSHIWPE